VDDEDGRRDEGAGDDEDDGAGEGDESDEDEGGEDDVGAEAWLVGRFESSHAARSDKSTARVVGRTARVYALRSSPVDTRSIAFAIPFFFLMIGLEAWLDLRRRRKARREPSARGNDDRTLEPAYRFADMVTSLSCGVGQQVLAITVVSVLAVGGYTLVYERARLFSISTHSVLGWIGCFVLVDLAYWTYHWASHRVNFLWATHVVHHQSEEYNLGTALRQSWFTGLTSWVFYLPIALLGFPPFMYVLAHTLNTLYQFWIHTRRVPKLGFLESFLNTPSHHRVHHGIDPEYIDKNYAGILIVWDRLFGTFAEERSEPAYGTVKPLASMNPFWANVEGFVALAKMSKATSKLGDKILVWVKPPEWRPADLGGPVTVPPVDHKARVKYAPETTPAVRAYVAAQFAVTAVVVGLLLWFNESLGTSVRLGGVGVTLASLLVWGGLFERKAWAGTVEIVRLAAQIGLAAVVGATLESSLQRGALVGGAVVLAIASSYLLSRAIASQGAAHGGDLPAT
jgi:sterol desaturase/sphingolipid hydroxylase (fatty acid hydroxylase superfamily)